MAEWQPSRLTPVQLEERRRRGAMLLRAGRDHPAEIARQLGVSRTTVSRWQQTLETRGLRGLQRRPHSGRPPRLDARQWERLAALLLRGAVAAGFDTERWTLRRIAHVVERECGARYHFRSLGRVLQAHGWSPQRPVPRARERDERAVRTWVRQTWPALKKKGAPRAVGARLRG